MNYKDLQRVTGSKEVKAFQEMIDTTLELMKITDSINSTYYITQGNTRELSRLLYKYDLDYHYIEHIIEELRFTSANLRRTHYRLKQILENADFKLQTLRVEGSEND